METKLRAVFEGGQPGVKVTALCTELGISRDTFYKYRRRWKEEGPAGLVERSRRPHTSPNMISVEVEDEIVRLRKTLPLDNGAQTIAYHLERSGWPVPAVITIHRALERRGMIVAQPEKRPRSAWRRFEWPHPNDAWQIDATRWVLRSGREVWVMDVLDDHSRVVVAARVCDGPTGDAAWGAFCDGAERFGTPAHVMSDNGTCFTGRFLSGAEAAFERDLRALGVRHIRSTPGHPQTCGKIERFHQTLKRWLRSQPLARSRPELQHQLEEFLAFYNHRRPHRALGGATPTERWHASKPAVPGEIIPETPRHPMPAFTPSGPTTSSIGAASSSPSGPVTNVNDFSSSPATTTLESGDPTVSSAVSASTAPAATSPPATQPAARPSVSDVPIDVSAMSRDMTPCWTREITQSRLRVVGVRGGSGRGRRGCRTRRRGSPRARRSGGCRRGCSTRRR
jgi:transposase InsO family protein